MLDAAHPSPPLRVDADALAEPVCRTGELAKVILREQRATHQRPIRLTSTLAFNMTNGSVALGFAVDAEDAPFLPSEHLRGIFNLAGIGNPAILLHGRVVGKWKEKAGTVELTAFEPIPDADRERIVEEVIRLFMPKKIKWT